NIVSPGGDIDTREGRFMVKPGGEFNAVREIDSITVGSVVSDDISNQVKLSDMGITVRRAYEDPPSVICRVTEPRGAFPAVIVGVTMKSGQNIIDVCNRCTDRVQQMVEVNQVLPRDIVVEPVSNLADNVELKINEVIENVISAIIIVVVVVYVCVGLRTSLVMAASIPLVVLSSIAIISVFEVELEQISLASIIIALGLLVDNAVQVCDQTRTNLARGMKPTEAAVEAANVLAFPMLSGTLTTIAAFFPMLLALEGSTLEYIYSLPVTLTTTLGISWVLAMTFCVIMSALIIRQPADPDAPSSPIAWVVYRVMRPFKKNTDDGPSTERADGAGGGGIGGIYRATASLAISCKWLTVAAACGLLAATISLPVSTEFFPQDRKDQFYINVTTPETATILQTDEKVAEVERALLALSPFVNEAGEAVERVRVMR
ncbi:MAG: efflux RND transporter permease subunit, partial [Planctomycetota bacterium]